MIDVLDSTLWEGEQTPGVYFHEHTRLAIARQLDRVGVSIIEAGHPVATPRIRESVAHLATASLRARIATHARTCRADVDAALECGVEPRRLGRKMSVALDHMSGTSSARYRLRQLGVPEPPDALVARVLERVRCVGKTGRTAGQSELTEIVNWCERHNHDQSGLSAFNHPQGRAVAAERAAQMSRS